MIPKTKKKKTKGGKIVVFSGGSGGATILRGLKKCFHNPTAIVTMFDSGGSTGRLRDEFGILPPGDVRACILALAPEDKSKLLRSILNYRFASNGGLNGHNLGNLILTALGDISGGEEKGIEALSELLEIEGRVLPVTLNYSTLYARLSNGQILEGETTIDLRKETDLSIKKVFLEPKATIYPPTQEAIATADTIVFGPGDLYTSIIPSLLVSGVTKALSKSQAKLVYVCNIMTKPSETKNFDASMHAREILKYAHRDEFDIIICNESTIRKSVLDKYAREGKEPVRILDTLSQFTKKIVKKNLTSSSDILRHDSNILAEAIKEAIV
jgi:uncharacterized cofD-like protein